MTDDECPEFLHLSDEPRVNSCWRGDGAPPPDMMEMSPRGQARAAWLVSQMLSGTGVAHVGPEWKTLADGRLVLIGSPPAIDLPPSRR